MKKLLIVGLVGIFVLGASGLANAALVSFVDPFSGADTTSGWSNSDATTTLSYSSFTILEGLGTVTAYLGDSLRNLTHRATRGLGVTGGEDDEVDYRPGRAQERIEITFANPRFIDYVEIRSLYFPERGDQEVANLHYWLGATNVGNATLVGVMPLGSGNGLVSTSPNLHLDKIVFQVDEATNLSDFAVAKLNVNSTPEPATLSLLGLGMGILGLFRLRKKK
ncbi:MAG: PEP-CTERM sorting domain-containing protein [Candidatus Omnitrophota bacterium]